MCIVYYDKDRYPCKSGLCKDKFLESSKNPEAINSDGKIIQVCPECYSKVTFQADLYCCKTVNCKAIKAENSDYCLHHNENTPPLNFKIEVE